MEEEGWWDSLSFITALTRQEMMTLIEEKDHPIQLELFDHNEVAEVESEGDRYIPGNCNKPPKNHGGNATSTHVIC